MRLLIAFIFVVTLCSCHRLDVPSEFQNLTLKAKFYETSPADGKEIEGGGASVPTSNMRLGSIVGTVTSPGYSGHMREIALSITGISASGVEVAVRLFHSDDRVRLDQKILVPYKHPVTTALLPNIFFEAHFEAPPHA